MTNKYKLNNGYAIPIIATGTNRMDYEMLKRIINSALDYGLCHFDSARDYGNEAIVGRALQEIVKERHLLRENFFITTKVGNSQQKGKDMAHELSISLNNLKVNYIDLWMLHWPLPDYYRDNIYQMNELLKTGKVKSIGLANPQVRHLEALKKDGLLPQVIQIEHHPFRIYKELLSYCKDNNIIIQAYSPLCFMIDKVKDNLILKMLSQKYQKSIGQIILKWHIQHGVIPVFRTTNAKRFAENTALNDFELSDDDMNKIFSLDEDFKFIPESLHCNGY